MSSYTSAWFADTSFVARHIFRLGVVNLDATYFDRNCGVIAALNTNTEGTFTDLKKNLDNHSGMTKENRKRFINVFFLALESKL